MRFSAALRPRAFGSLAGFLGDRALGEPPANFHPVVWIGNSLETLERRTYRDSKGAGVVHLTLGLAGATLAGATLQGVLGRGMATALSVGLASAGQMLGESALNISSSLKEDDLEGARQSLPTLVGRDPSQLDASEISRAVIESVAENTVDAVTASIFYGLIGGPVGVCIHRVSNTLDAMVGHRNDRYMKFGWASARFDDALGFVPARLTLVAITVANPRRWHQTLACARDDAGQHPSPNGGIVEAGFAGALDLTLGGSNTYGGVQEDRGELGSGPKPMPSDIDRSVELASKAGLVFAMAPVCLMLIADRLAGTQPRIQ